MGRSGRAGAQHPDKQTERRQDADDHSNSRALAHLHTIQSPIFLPWLSHGALRCGLMQLRSTLSALEADDAEGSCQIAVWEECFSDRYPGESALMVQEENHHRRFLEGMLSDICTAGFLMFPLAGCVVAEGFERAFEHFNGVYEALKDNEGRTMQFYAQIGDMDKGFEERRHGFVTHGSPYLFFHPRGCWVFCEQLDLRSGIWALSWNDAFSPEHIAPGSVWSCCRKGRNIRANMTFDLDNHVTVRLADNADLTPQKRWHRATPNLPSWSEANIPPVDISSKRAHVLPGKLGNRKANQQSAEMPTGRSTVPCLRARDKRKLALLTSKEMRKNCAMRGQCESTNCVQPQN